MNATALASQYRDFTQPPWEPASHSPEIEEAYSLRLIVGSSGSGILALPQVFTVWVFRYRGRERWCCSARESVSGETSFGRYTTGRSFVIHRAIQVASGIQRRLWSTRSARDASIRGPLPCVSAPAIHYRRFALCRHAGKAVFPAEYKVWCSMLQRCANPRARHYKHYGGRGISVCAEWQESFVAFIDDMGPRPTPEHSIDRINNDGNYEPGNCRWATREQQARNKQATKYIELEGERMTIPELADRFALPRAQVSQRIRGGQTPEQAVSAPAYYFMGQVQRRSAENDVTPKESRRIWRERGWLPSSKKKVARIVE